MSVEIERPRSLRERAARPLRFATLALVAALVFWAAHALWASPVFAIRSIEVRGPVETLGLEEVTRAVRRGLANEGPVARVFPVNIVSADIEAVRRSVEELSWVREARVRRLWPDALHVDVVRHRSVAIWDDGRLVSEAGLLFSSNDEPIERLVRLPAFGGDPQYVAQAVHYLTLFEEQARRIGARVKGVHITFRGSWSVTLDAERFQSLTIELGRALSVNGPVVRLAQVVDNFERVSKMMQGYPDRIDARYQNAFAAKIPSERAHEAWKKHAALSDAKLPEQKSSGLAIDVGEVRTPPPEKNRRP
ncbi:MAG: cell division protein FtsQ/DivIB [Duodenibacillus sp.]